MSKPYNITYDQKPTHLARPLWFCRKCNRRIHWTRCYSKNPRFHYWYDDCLSFLFNRSKAQMSPPHRECKQNTDGPRNGTFVKTRTVETLLFNNPSLLCWTVVLRSFLFVRQYFFVSFLFARAHRYSQTLDHSRRSYSAYLFDKIIDNEIIHIVTGNKNFQMYEWCVNISGFLL